MNKYRTPNGRIVSESDLINKYGQDQFNKLVASGKFTLVTEEVVKEEVVEEVVEEQAPVVTEEVVEEEVIPDTQIFDNGLTDDNIYITPNGTEADGNTLIDKYGQDQFNKLVANNQLKKKDQLQNSTSGTVDTDGITPPAKETELFSDSSVVVNKNNLSDVYDDNSNTQVNSILVNNIPFSELSPEDQVAEIKRRQKDVDDGIGDTPNPDGYFYQRVEDLKLLTGYAETMNPLVMKNVGSTVVDGKFRGKRKIPGGMIAVSANDPSDRNFLQKLFYSDEEVLELEEKSTIPVDILNKVEVDVADYRAWEDENTKEDAAYVQEIKDFYLSDEAKKYSEERRNLRKLASYSTSVSDDITADLNIIENKLKFISDPATRANLISKRNQLQANQLKNAGRQYAFIKLFPELEKEQDLRTLRRKQYVINQRDGDFTGGLAQGANTLSDVAISFVGAFVGFIPTVLETGLNAVGLEDSFMANGTRAINESIDVMLNSDGRLVGNLGDPLKRSTVENTKEVMTTFDGQPHQVSVTKRGQILDSNTMMDMSGMFTTEEVKDILEKSKKVPEFGLKTTGAAFTEGTAGTVTHLLGLIYSGKWATKTIQKGLIKTGSKRTVKGGVGMGVSSYASSLTTEVNSIKEQLMAGGVPEQEAYDRAILYGNGRASLDGIFSGLAGSNVKLLANTKNYRKILSDLVMKPKSVVSSKVFKQKVKDLANENFKEVVVEELPVLISGNFLNSLANDSVGKEILNETTSYRDVVETVVLTLGATTGVGSKKLMLGNSRKALLRTATESSNIEAAINESVKAGNITEAEGAAVYKEVYAMQTAVNQTQGTIIMPENIEPAGALLTQRGKLVQKKEGLEGPLKADIEKQIVDIDIQIKNLKDADTEQAMATFVKENPDIALKAALDNITREDAIEALKEEGDGRVPTENEISNKLNELVKKETDAIQESTTKKKVLSDDGTSQETEKDANVELPGVGKGDTRKTSIENNNGKQGNVSNENEQEIDTDSSTSTEGEVMSVNKTRVDKVVDNIIIKTRNRNKRRGNRDNKQSEADNAIKYLEQSKLFNESNDSEKEAMIQEINKKLGVEIPSPTKRQIDAKKNKKKLNNVDESAALKDQIRLEVKAANDSKKDQTTRRKSLAAALKALQKAGKITTGKMTQLINKVSGVNLNNPLNVAKVLNFAEKVNNDANAIKKINDAKAKQRSIKKSVKGAEANVQVAVKQFLDIDIDLVSDIDAYNAKAQTIIDGLKKSKGNKDGKLITAESVDIKSLDKFSNDAIKKQEKILREAEAQSFRDLTGLNSNELTLVEMRNIIHDQKVKEAENKKDTPPTPPGIAADLINKATKKAFNTYKSIVDSLINDQVDPFTGEKIKVDAAKQEIVRKFMNIDLDLMSQSQKLQALDSMINFATNQTTGGMALIVAVDTANKNIITTKKKGLIARQLKTYMSTRVGSAWNTWLAQLPLQLESMFKGQSGALSFEKLSGFMKIRRGAAKAEKITNNISDLYAETFITNVGNVFKAGKERFLDKERTNPNGKPFTDISNDQERGMFAFMRRTVIGTKSEQQTEFNRRKKLVEESIRALEADGQTELAKVAREVFNKFVKDSKDINDLSKGVDPVNIAAVEFMQDQWAQKRVALENVSLNVYNKVLGKDINYIPDSINRIKLEDDIPKLGEPVFQAHSESIYDKKTGVLIEAKKPTELTNRVVSFAFDSQNIRKLKAALTDIETAEGIAQLKAFIENPEFKNIIPDLDNREAIKKRFNEYVNAKRGVSTDVKSDKETKIWLGRLNRLAGLGVSRVLGGPTQYLKQLTPLVNTLINLFTAKGIASSIQGIRLATTNKDAMKWIENLGVDVSNRGLQATTNLEGSNTKLDNSSRNKFNRFMSGVDVAQKFWLQKFLVKPDLFAARASFMAYYVNDLKKQGIETSGIDWKTHKENTRAAEYAQQQLGRQQNTSDADLQGKLFSSKKVGPQILRKVFFPFANFLINQKSRMLADISVLSQKTGPTTQDKIAATRSLAGLIGESVAFNALGLLITQTLANLTALGDDDEEKQTKDFENRKKGRAGNIITDIVSPIPAANPVVLKGINAMIETFSDEEKPYQFFEGNRQGVLDRLGVLGIGLKAGEQIYDLFVLGVTGKYTDNYGGKKEIDPMYKDSVKMQSVIYMMYVLGLLPSETGTVVNNNIKSYKRRGVTKPMVIDVPTKKKKKKKRKIKDSGPIFKKNKSGGLF